MLHLKFALELSQLADLMIDEISKHWKSPFEAPTVIFPDSKLEQWFRLRWVEKKGVLANFQKSSIDKFLFDALSSDEKKESRLTVDRLRHVILAYLLKKEEKKNQFNYETLSPEVSQYLTSEGVLDENRLFDFAHKMASLFLEYEASRPGGFFKKNKSETWAAGILDCWNEEKSGTLFFSEKDSGEEQDANAHLKNREEWQRKLYSALFHKKEGRDSLLTRTFEKVSARAARAQTFLTVPYLYQSLSLSGKNSPEKENAPFNDSKKLPVFIFGLSGMGQFYRVILQKYAEAHEVYAYIQNPCMEFWEDAKAPCKHWQSRKGVLKTSAGNVDQTLKEKLTWQNEENIPEENALLASWGRIGRDNIRLWCQAADYDFDFYAKKEDAEKNSPTLLHKVKESIAKRKGKLDFSQSEKSPLSEYDFSLSLYSSPSKIREVEHIHGEICRLLQSGSVRLEDIVVVSPKLEEYRSAIQIVFEQTAAFGRDLHIPFQLVDFSSNNSFVKDAVEALFQIAEEGSLSRPSFFRLLRNPMVRAVREISESDLEAWEGWIEKMNVYRHRKSSNKNDWLIAVQRLLLSHLSKNRVKFFDGESEVERKPFSDLESEDSEGLSRFADCIFDLKKWMDLFGEKKEITDSSMLFSIQKELNTWLSFSKVFEEWKAETIIYGGVLSALELLRWEFDAGVSSIPLKVIERSVRLGLDEAAENFCGAFGSGISFMQFAPNRVLPVKHVFFMGGDNSFPGEEQSDTLDLRKSSPPWPGDDSIRNRNRYAFLCQLMSASEGFHISYVGKNLEKDEELYPSSLVTDLQKFLQESSYEWNAIEIPFAERPTKYRDFESLWTKRELRNRLAYEKMMSFTDKERKNPSSNKTDEAAENFNANKWEGLLLNALPSQVSFYNLKKYLEDPFEFWADKMFGEKDFGLDPVEELEPIALNNLDQSSELIKMAAGKILGNEKSLDELKKDLSYEGKLSSGFFEEMTLEKMEKSIPQEFIDEFTEGTWIFKKKIEVLLGDEKNRWKLEGNLDFIDSDDFSQVTRIVSLVSGTISARHRISSYLQALAILAQQESSEKRSLTTKIYSAKDKKTEEEFSFSSSEARALLERIYKNAYGEIEGDTKRPPYFKAVPADWILKETSFDDIYSFSKKLTDEYNGPWRYFKRKNMFDIEKDVGFQLETFSEEWVKAYNKMKALLKIKIEKKSPGKK